MNYLFSMKFNHVSTNIYYSINKITRNNLLYLYISLLSGIYVARGCGLWMHFPLMERTKKPIGNTTAERENRQAAVKTI